MKRNKDGKLEFNSPQEKAAYEFKRKQFLAAPEEELVKQFNNFAAKSVKSQNLTYL